jgi:hypothetical protein
MCTVTWQYDGSALELFDNRDERRRRAPAEPPRIHRHGKRPFIAPVDGDFGGTWISANDRGLVLCLLNRYLEEGREDRQDYVSRGLLVRDLAMEESPESLARDLEFRDLEVYRPFSLLVARPDHEPMLWVWNGERLHTEKAVMPLISSPRAAEVLALRSKVLQEMQGTWEGSESELLLAFHRGHQPFKGPASVCMHHPLAKTVSFTRVRIDDHRVSMHYVPGSPCEDAPPQRIEMMRSSQ